jgi:hypothetical protein
MNDIILAHFSNKLYSTGVPILLKKIAVINWLPENRGFLYKII